LFKKASKYADPVEAKKIKGKLLKVRKALFKAAAKANVVIIIIN
jgi:hypothetical protein